MYASESPKIAPHRTIVREGDYRSLAYKIAVEKGLDADRFVSTIDCENDTWNPARQSEISYKEGNRWGFPAGTKERSFGLAMIHLPDHPSVSHEQATDPVFALTWMADKWSKGKQQMWSCY